MAADHATSACRSSNASRRYACTTQPSCGPARHSSPSERSSSSVRSFASSCSMSRWTVAPARRARSRSGCRRSRTSARPAAAVSGAKSGESAVGFTDTFTRGTVPHGSCSSRGFAGHRRAVFANVSRSAATRVAYASASRPVIVRSPRTSTDDPSPFRHSRASRGIASAGVAPAISWRAMRRMLRRAAAAVTCAPNGRCAATPRPTPSAGGTSIVAK